MYAATHACLPHVATRACLPHVATHACLPHVATRACLPHAATLYDSPLLALTMHRCRLIHKWNNRPRPCGSGCSVLSMSTRLRLCLPAWSRSARGCNAYCPVFVFAPAHLPAPDTVLRVSAHVRRGAVADARLGLACRLIRFCVCFVLPEFKIAPVHRVRDHALMSGVILHTATSSKRQLDWATTGAPICMRKARWCCRL